MNVVQLRDDGRLLELLTPASRGRQLSDSVDRRSPRSLCANLELRWGN